ncbi:L,D-transpeptidase family protein [uncultured Clostridium sp.]|uniref:L,D-transpeptidase family protein n=1 Tax=uncultured Clostridium sp. TaxID=59620 RepID=UPI0025CFEFAD|nr:L,D-transpeptidase family protein [uncultured Clostridium sp.]
MKYYVENDKYDEKRSDDNYDNKDKDWNSNVMVSRTERNKRKKNSKFISISKGRRYKKNDNRLNVPIIKIKVRSIAVIILLAGGSYICCHTYFKNHFYLGSTINCINISAKSIEEAQKAVKDSIDNYTITLNGRDGTVDVLNGNDFDIKFNSDDVIKDMKEKQNETLWINSLINYENKEENNMLIQYNEEKLNNLIDNLSFFEQSKIVEPQNPKYIYENNEFKIEDEVYGNKIDKDMLKEKIKEAILSGETVIDIDEEKCYENPQYTKSSEKASKIKNALNEYKNSKIVYDLGNSEEVIDMNTMKEWLDIDAQYNASINQEKVREFVDVLADKYDTVGKSRIMYSTSGREVTIPGGDYGFKIDRNTETEQLIQNLESRQAVNREPVYEQKGINNVINDIEKTCVEIDLTNQHLWFYKDGNIITEGDIVSGCITNGTITPEGTYSLKYKAKDSVLVGENYRSPVSFWMPFNGNIGLHDASWRYKFGGQIYMTSGSHGCVNLPYSLANDIFYNIDEGTPVICYY